MNEFTMAELIPLIQKEAQKQGVDPQTAVAIFVAENTADGVIKPDKKVSIGTKSPKNAQGVMQVLPSTFAALQKQGYLAATHSLDTLEGQIAGGVAALKEAQTRLGTTDAIKLGIAYNASPAAGKHYEKTGILPTETAGYTKKMERTLGMADKEQSQGSESVSATVSGRGVPQSALSTVQTSLSMFKESMAEAMGLTKRLIASAVGDDEAQKAAVRLSEQGAQELNAGKTDQAVITNLKQRNIVEQFGVDSSNPDSMVSKANQALAVADQALLNMRPEMDALKSVDPLRDPIGYLVAQFKMVGAAGKWNAAANARDNAMEIIQGRHQIATSAQAAEPALIADSLRRQSIGQAKTIQANATSAVLEIDAKTRLLQLNQLRSEQEWQQDKFRGDLAIAGLEEQSLAAGMRRSKVEQDAAALKRLNEVAALHGMKPFVSVDLAKMDTPEKDALLAKAATRPGDFGASPPEAMTAVTAFGSIEHIRKTMPVAAQFYTTFGAKAKEVMKDLKFQQETSKLPYYAQVEKAYAEVYKAWEDEAAKKSNDMLSDSNPRKMQAKTFAAAPELKNNMIAQFVSAFPSGKQPREEEVFSYAIGQIQSGKPRAQVVRELQEFFARGQKHQYEAMGLGVLNYPARDAGKTDNGEISYTITPSYTGNFGMVDNILGRDENNKKVNVLNTAELNNALILILARSSAQGPNRLLNPEANQQE